MDVRTLCLGILALGDASGYEIKKMVAEGSFSFFSEASYGSIYPALTRLTEEGLVTCREEAQDKRPDKKVYSLTPAGRAALRDTLRKDPGPDRHRSEFLAALLFAEAVSPERVRDLIDERVAQHEKKIAELKGLLEEDVSAVSRFVIEYGIATQEAALHYLKRHRDRLLGELGHTIEAAE
ncbi:MAG: PadR family transcriptional regulator [Alphaproteobacteria bacterium]|nr:MAG: PadR family transcriptional regulator [Alphaproteobacteria bacterium]